MEPDKNFDRLILQDGKRSKAVTSHEGSLYHDYHLAQVLAQMLSSSFFKSQVQKIKDGDTQLGPPCTVQCSTRFFLDIITSAIEPRY